MKTEETDLAALAALNEPARRRLYQYVAGEEAPVSREAAAEALGLGRSVAAFHLDKLADLGLLEVEYHRPAGRTGPGAGRPAKYYRRAAGEIGLSVPERHYDLAALLLARAVEEAADGSVPVADALATVARDYGRSIGIDLPEVSNSSRKRVVQRIAELLADHGYEPQVDDSCISLRNCPFHALAEEHRQLVCGMNRELIAGVVEAAGLPETAARLDPVPGRCCVTVDG